MTVIDTLNMLYLANPKYIMEWHIHHIIPRYRCKELGIDPDRPENLLKVNRKMHAMLHKIRFEEFGDIRDDMAVRLLEGTVRKDDWRKLPRKKGVSRNKGRVMSEEHKRKISEARKKQVANGIAKPPTSKKGRPQSINPRANGNA